MRALVLLLGVGSAFAAPPVTPEEASLFHEKGLCAITEPGTGLRRKDGDGWIVSPLPGPHRLFVEGGQVSRPNIDFTPGNPEQIRVLPPGAKLEWCPAFRPQGRDECGPVPPSLLWDAKKASDF